MTTITGTMSGMPGKAIPQIVDSMLVEYFDFKYFKTDSEKEKIIAPDKKG